MAYAKPSSDFYTGSEDNGPAVGLEEKTAQETIRNLKATLGAIHFHSGKFSVRHWKFVPKTSLVATLKTIHEFCEETVPELEEL